jgi:hypothetical protein
MHRMFGFVVAQYRYCALCAEIIPHKTEALLNIDQGHGCHKKLKKPSKPIH